MSKNRSRYRLIGLYSRKIYRLTVNETRRNTLGTPRRGALDAVENRNPVTPRLASRRSTRNCFEIRGIRSEGQRAATVVPARFRIVKYDV